MEFKYHFDIKFNTQNRQTNQLHLYINAHMYDGNASYAHYTQRYDCSTISLYQNIIMYIVCRISLTVEACSSIYSFVSCKRSSCLIINTYIKFGRPLVGFCYQPESGGVFEFDWINK